ncbi:MAG: glycosyltransferase family 2 protein [Anaerolineales bacterium]|nr:glycosyltransferase family 2 protein [Anaerolineales bacterium]
MDNSALKELMQAMRDQMLSVIVPVYNEKDNILPLYEALHAVLDGFRFELVFINDGSKDESIKVLEKLAEEDPEHVVLVDFRRNYGQTAAMAAGIDYSSGDIIIMIDADMQNDPADIPELLAKIHEGYDLVSGWRVSRKDTFLTRTLPSRMANWLISVVTGVRLHDYGCSLKAYRREVLEGFRLYGEMHRFIPAYAGSVGARVTEIPVNHHPRLYGKANYGLERTFKVLLDLITVKFLISYGGKPIYLFGGFGIISILISFISLGYIGFRKLAYEESLVRSPLLLMSVMLFMIGLQSIMSGLIAELLARTYYESQSKPAYSVRRVVNVQQKGTQSELEQHLSTEG